MLPRTSVMVSQQLADFSLSSGHFLAPTFDGLSLWHVLDAHQLEEKYTGSDMSWKHLNEQKPLTSVTLWGKCMYAVHSPCAWQLPYQFLPLPF